MTVPSLPDERTASLVRKLEQFGESLSAAEREVVRRIADLLIDPWTMMRRRQGNGLFDSEELAFLQKLEREP
jgi:hypothetical protein